MVAMHTAFVLAKGESWFGKHTTKSKVISVQIEVPKFAYQERIRDYLRHNPYKDNTVPNLYWINEPVLKLDAPLEAKLLEREISRIRPDVLMVDPLYKTFTRSTADAVDVQRWQDNLDNLAHKYNLGIIVFAHLRKQSQGLDLDAIQWGEELFGSSYFENWFDTSIHLKHVASKPMHYLTLTFTKNPRNAKTTLSPIEVEIDERDLIFKVRIPSKEEISVKKDVEEASNTT